VTPLIAALALAQGSHDEGFFKSEGTLVISEIKVVQEKPVAWRPLEMTFKLTGTWSNPFDPRQIDVTAHILGPGNTAAEMPAFLYAPGDWRLRFAPWRVGKYFVELSAIDNLSRVDTKAVEIRVGPPSESDKSSAGFLEAQPKQRYLSVGDRTVFPIGTTFVTSLRDVGGILQAVDKLAELGYNACRIVLRKSAFQYEPAKFSLQCADALEAILKRADKNRISVFLCLGERADFEADWKNNPFRAMCEKPNDFWENLKARVAYKKWLRYVVSRFSGFPSLAGIEFVDSLATPGYWLEEMAAEVFALHPFRIPIVSFQPENLLFERSRVNVSQIELSALFEKPIAVEPRAPVFALSKAGDSSSFFQALACGAAGVFFDGSDSSVGPKAFAEFMSGFDLNKRKLERAEIEGEQGWGVLDGDGGVVFVKAKSEGEITFKASRSAYKYAWFNASTGKLLSEGTAKGQGGRFRIAHPPCEGGAVCKLTR
jgi:hypothetical protein